MNPITVLQNLQKEKNNRNNHFIIKWIQEYISTMKDIAMDHEYNKDRYRRYKTFSTIYPMKKKLYKAIFPINNEDILVIQSRHKTFHYSIMN